MKEKWLGQFLLTRSIKETEIEKITLLRIENKIYIVRFIRGLGMCSKYSSYWQKFYGVGYIFIIKLLKRETLLVQDKNKTWKQLSKK